ncbi:hypothetical protein QR77_35180 [Streptomyces sp. 150FB]|uniref:hypothetical protein n=1 Tax=Streptomyces sp. 150FB TaxID=1576605 RepID=UPI00058945AB|nr:hypothetical protein [Streptomyces sp. 150FB]KIF77660.1 hypothetical protein QR77_35180 [Streptomyces sp. 150FB]
MPIDPFAVLNAILRAEAARAEKARLRRPAASADNDVVAAGARSGAAQDRTPAASAPDESRTPR